MGAVDPSQDALCSRVHLRSGCAASCLHTAEPADWDCPLWLQDIPGSCECIQEEPPWQTPAA